MSNFIGDATDTTDDMGVGFHWSPKVRRVTLTLDYNDQDYPVIIEWSYEMAKAVAKNLLKEIRERDGETD